jgi:hypothetical protein
MLPFLALLIACALEWASHRTLANLAVWILAIVSIALIWAVTLGGQSFPPENQANPLFEYSLPRLFAGDIARNIGMILGLGGLQSLIPLAVLVVGLLVLIARLSYASRWGVRERA